MKNLSIRQIKCLITLILSVFLCGVPAVAQTQKIAVKLDMTKVPMKVVMNEIEKQTKYLFLYTDEIDTERIVSIKADSKPLNEVLPLLFKDTDITYEITVPNIVLSKRVSAARPFGHLGRGEGFRRFGHYRSHRSDQGDDRRNDHRYPTENFTLTLPASVDNPELSVSFIGYETVSCPSARARLSTSHCPIRPSRSSRSLLRPWALNVPRRRCRTTYSRWMLMPSSLTRMSTSSTRSTVKLPA